MSQPSTHLQTPQDSIVVVMGPTGTGKSTFIERATRQESGTVGHKLRTCTTDIRSVNIIHPENGRSVVFVDTPGFDGPSMSDVQILSMIADFLRDTYKEKAKLATIIYLHKIDDNRMTGSLLKHLQTFANLCGQTTMPNVVIVTTMWGRVTEEEGARREAELKKEFWKDMVADGCKTERFENTYDSAWRVIDSHAGKDVVPALSPDDDERYLGDSYVPKSASKRLDLEAFTNKLRGLFSRFRSNR